MVGGGGGGWWVVEVGGVGVEGGLSRVHVKRRRGGLAGGLLRVACPSRRRECVGSREGTRGMVVGGKEGKGESRCCRVWSVRILTWRSFRIA